MGELIEQSAQHVAELFLASSELPSVDLVDDREITGFSTSNGVADDYVRELNHDEKVALLAEVIVEDEKYDFQVLSIFKAGYGSAAEVINSLIAHLVGEKARLIPAVIERDESNMRQHDLFLGYDDED